MYLDPIMLPLTAALLVILIVGTVTNLLHQPSVVAYLVAGCVLGPFGLGLITDQNLLDRLGAVGVVLLLFFVGMEASPKKLVANWKVALLGTSFQVLASIGCVWVVGALLDWPIGRIILLGCVISLSSTAVVLGYLQERQQLDSDLGQDALAVLLTQDVLVVPMLIGIAMLGGGVPETQTLVMQVIGGIAIISLMAWLTIAESVHLPFAKYLRRNQELQVFVALLLCFGLALITGLFELSTALGAFVAGMLVGAAKETDWVHHRLESFRVVLVALFFVSVGMLVDLNFLREQWWLISIILVSVFLTNTFLNAGIFRLLGDRWRYSLQAGALLASLGEFSFVLAAIGLTSGMISNFGYQLSVAVIALSLLIGPPWIGLINRLTRLKTETVQ